MRVASFLICIVLTMFASGQTNAELTLDKKSALVIHGSTNLFRFDLSQNGDKIMTEPLRLTASLQGSKLYVNKNKLFIHVENFKSANLIAQSEFYKLLMTDKYPELKIQLDYVDFGAQKRPFEKGNAMVSITITGVTKPYLIPVAIIFSNNRICIKGRKRMSIRDFGLQPPVSALKMVKVSEWIEIELDLFGDVRLLPSKN